jgi:hypothetical protein
MKRPRTLMEKAASSETIRDIADAMRDNTITEEQLIAANQPYHRHKQKLTREGQALVKLYNAMQRPPRRCFDAREI